MRDYAEDQRDHASITVEELAKELGFGEDIEGFKAWAGDMPKYVTARILSVAYAAELRAAMRYQRENESKD